MFWAKKININKNSVHPELKAETEQSNLNSVFITYLGRFTWGN